MSLQKVVFRADANPKIGTGHVMRCLLLVEEFVKQQVECLFVAESMPSFLVDHITAAGARFCQEVNPNASVFTYLKANALLVVDSDDEVFYTPEFAQQVKQLQAKFFLIAFQFQQDFQCDLLLNQNILALSKSYASSTNCLFLLGPHYAILKSEFGQLAQQPKPKHELEHVLISYGGTDQLRRTEHTLKALLKLEINLQAITVVVGGLYCCLPKVQELAQQFSIPVEVIQNTPNMPALMHNSTVAFTSGGLTAWELGSVSTFNVVWSYTNRERISGEYLMEQEMSYFLGHSEELLQSDLTASIGKALKFTRKQEFTQNLREAVNPSGKQKVVQACFNLF